MTQAYNKRIAKTTFASVYPHYLLKLEKKGRTADERLYAIARLTRYDEIKVQELIDDKTILKYFLKT